MEQSIVNDGWTKSNGGITWFNSDYTGPGNLAVSKTGKFIGKRLPQFNQDWNTLEYDVEYYNLSTDPKHTIDDVAKNDKEFVEYFRQLRWCGSYNNWIGIETRF